MSGNQLWSLLIQGVWDTLYMTIPSTIFAYVLGLPLGVLLVITKKGGIKESTTFNAVLGAIINFLRSIPFIILLVMLFPVTRIVMGTAIGTRSIIFPLVVSAFPYVARMVESSLDEVDQDNFDQAVDMILSAKHIYIIGMRTSTTLADFLGIYLKLLLDNVTVVKEIAAREVYEQMLRIGEGDLIIGISYPRYSKRTISAMKFARDHGARCLGMTDSKVSPLNEISDVCLYAKSEMVSFLDSLVAPMSLINALIMAVSARDRERTFETFRELETVWKEYEVYGTVES